MSYSLGFCYRQEAALGMIQMSGKMGRNFIPGVMNPMIEV